MCVCIGASFQIAQTGNTKFHSNLSVYICVCATRTQNQQQKLCALSKTNLFIEQMLGRSRVVFLLSGTCDCDSNTFLLYKALVEFFYLICSLQMKVSNAYRNYHNKHQHVFLFEIDQVLNYLNHI